MVIEFDFDGPGSSAGAEEPLPDDGSRIIRRLPQWAWIGAAALVLLIALIVTVRRGSPAKPSAPISSTPSASTSSFNNEPMALQLMMTAIALDNDPLSNVIRSTPSGASCPAPKNNKLPLPAELAAIRAAFPLLGNVETSTILDASAGLCSVTIRERAQDNSVFVMRIGAPPNPVAALVTVDQAGLPGSYPTFVGADRMTDDGFRVQIAILGTGREGASLDQLIDLARNGSLTW